MFLSLDLLSEYRIQHDAIGPIYATSSYSTWIFCRGVSGFATDCPCEVWCRGLTTCLLHVGPPFWNRFLNTSWAVGLTYWIVYLHFVLYFNTCNYICLDSSYRFWLHLYFLNILYFFKYSWTNNFHRHSLCTFYWFRWWLAPGWHQAIIWINAGILLIRRLEKLQWNLNRNFIEVLITKNAFENVVWEMSAILSRPHCVKIRLYVNVVWLNRVVELRGYMRQSIWHRCFPPTPKGSIWHLHAHGSVSIMVYVSWSHEQFCPAINIE